MNGQPEVGGWGQDRKVVGAGLVCVSFFLVEVQSSMKTRMYVYPGARRWLARQVVRDGWMDGWMDVE